MNSFVSEDPFRYAAETLLSFLSRFEEQAAGIAPGADIEFLHRARVATRRLRAALSLFAPLMPEGRDDGREQAASVRRVTNALGAARDLDVQILFLREKIAALVPAAESGKALLPGLNRLLLRKTQSRARLEGRLIRALLRWRDSGTSDRLRESLRRAVMASEERNAPTDDRLARIAAQAERELRSARSFDLFVRDETAVTELHELRKATKRVRYMLEMLDPLSGGALSDVADRFRALQDDLGAIHDCDVWIAEIPPFLARERERTAAYFGSPRPFARIVAGAEFLLDDRRAERSKLYGSFVKTWERELADGLFGRASDLLNGRGSNENGEAADA